MGEEWASRAKPLLKEYQAVLQHCLCVGPQPRGRSDPRAPRIATDSNQMRPRGENRCQFIYCKEPINELTPIFIYCNESAINELIPIFTVHHWRCHCEQARGPVAGQRKDAGSAAGLHGRHVHRQRLVRRGLVFPFGLSNDIAGFGSVADVLKDRATAGKAMSAEKLGKPMLPFARGAWAAL